jgi:hypothetical protein
MAGIEVFLRWQWVMAYCNDIVIKLRRGLRVPACAGVRYTEKL